MRQANDNVEDSMTDNTRELLERRLLNDFQRGFPLTPAPFACIARDLGVNEQAVIACLKKLYAQNKISRVGPVFNPNRVGVSTLAAMVVAPEQLQEVADIVSAYQEVNHNYEREHQYNLWFVVTAENEILLNKVLNEIETKTGISVMKLPMLEAYHIDLGFKLKWS